ncbi:polyribonucleotide nucleotidyltransferase [Gemmatimonadota bacterium]
MTVKKEVSIGGRVLSIETGKVARQANGAAWVQYGGTVVLVTATATKKPKDMPYFPLMVEYRAKAYAAGRIPGGFFKREGPPREREIVSARQIDRSIRPLFPSDYRNDVQVFVSIISSDTENDADFLGLIGASASLNMSDIPFAKTIAGVRVGRIEGEMVINPTRTQMKESDIELVVAGSADSIVMVEGGASIATEADMVEALAFAHENIKPIVEMIDELKAEVGKPKQDYEKVGASDEFVARVNELAREKILAVNQVEGKHEREEAMDEVLALVRQETEEEFADQQRYVYDVTHDIQSEEMRRVILESGKRVDGRQPEDIRDITCEVSVLPQTHGSALFTRGETQALTVTTLGTKQDEQRMDELEGESWKSYMLHYNFPSFSVGEVRPVRGPSRRDIGHGMLAERALRPVIPTEEFFPYTIRIVSDILESNGSSSMATVCAGSLSLMDTGVPIKEAVAGIAMGLIHEGDKDVILTDITGTEDHLGDMDFKVAGTRGGITSIQMDIKIDGVSRDLLAVALDRAREARLSILDSMKTGIETPRTELNEKAPRIISLKINPSKIGEVIGPGGKVIRSIQESTGAKIDIDNDGLVTIASVDKDACEQAFAMVSALVEEAEPGKIYQGTVRTVVKFGAFIEIMPGKDGLCHISELAAGRVNEVEDVLREGDKVRVKCIGTDDNGKIKLSLKAAIEELDEESVWIQKVPR